MFVKYHKENNGLYYDVALIDESGEVQHHTVHCSDLRPYITALENVGLEEISERDFYCNYQQANYDD